MAGKRSTVKTIGLAGFGFIGSFLYERLQANNDISVQAVWEPVAEKTRDLDQTMVCKDLADLGSRSLDLIVEVAHADVVKALWPLIRSDANIMIASMTCLADPEFRSQMERDAREHGRKIFLPHGAILALDGLRDGRALLDQVSITTTKHPRSLGLTVSEMKKPEVLFKGSTRDACSKFPRNVNVHAAIAMAGLGFEKTQSIIIADPNTNKMHHRIEVKGRGLRWDLEVESFAAGDVTGSYTPESLYQSLITIASNKSGFCIV
jgi:aspartate dehydrogenase